MEWWSGLTALNQAFYASAGFFSLIFIWQFISSLIGLSGGEGDVEIDVDTDIDTDAAIDLDSIEAHSLEEAAETVAAFKILSIRAILAFLTLFSWASALYLDMGKSRTRALVYATLWGLAAWTLVAVLVYWLRKLAETGNERIASCVGRRGTVYMNIPTSGAGKVRVMISGRIAMVSARGAGGASIDAGTPVRVVRALDATSVEVSPSATETEQPTGSG